MLLAQDQKEDTVDLVQVGKTKNRWLLSLIISTTVKYLKCS